MLLFCLLLVLFPFVIPVLKKMNVTLLPSNVMDFFKGVFTKMKKEREKGSSTVGPAQVAFSLHSAVFLSAGGSWWHLEKLWCIAYSPEQLPAHQTWGGPETCPAWASIWRKYLCSQRVSSGNFKVP